MSPVAKKLSETIMCLIADAIPGMTPLELLKLVESMSLFCLSECATEGNYLTAVDTFCHRLKNTAVVLVAEGIVKA